MLIAVGNGLCDCSPYFFNNPLNCINIHIIMLKLHIFCINIAFSHKNCISLQTEEAVNEICYEQRF